MGNSLQMCVMRSQSEQAQSQTLLQETLELWGEHYQQRLHEEDGKEILSNISQFFDLLSEWSANS
jgi:hypothetical protein